MRLALLLLLAISSARAVAADCAMVEYYPNVLTPASTDIGDKGGVVVAQLAFAQRPKTAAKTWKFRGGNAPKVTAIAPGLDVYVPASRGGKLVLEDGDGKPVVELTSGGKRTELPVPAIKAIVFTEHRGRHGSAQTVAELAGDPPDGAVALVVYDKAGKARSFGTVIKNAKQAAVFSQSDCGGPFQGTVVSRTGEEVRVAWVDASGAVSKQSNLIKVK